MYTGSSSAASPYINPSGDKHIWTSYAAGQKIYGGGRSAPNIGPVDPLGYAERDQVFKARQAAIVKRMKAKSMGAYSSSDYIGSI